MKNRIREFREKKGWSQQKLADLVGTSQPQIDRLEKNQRRISDYWLEKLAKAFDNEALEFISGDEIAQEVLKIPISGIIDQKDGTINFLEEPNEFIECPIGLPIGDVAAVRIRGKELMPFYYNGWVLFYTTRNDIKLSRPSGAEKWVEEDYSGKGDGQYADRLNRPCIVKITGGATMLAILKNGRQQGRYDLAGFYTTDALDDQQIDWAARIVYIKT